MAFGSGTFTGKDTLLPPEEPKDENICPTCGKNFKTPFELAEHLLKHLNNTLAPDEAQTETTTEEPAAEAKPKRPWKCDQCSARFETNSELEEHKALHGRPASLAPSASPLTKTFQYTCDICGEQFPTYTALTNHRVLHPPAQGTPPGGPVNVTGRQLVGSTIQLEPGSTLPGGEKPNPETEQNITNKIRQNLTGSNVIPDVVEEQLPPWHKRMEYGGEMGSVPIPEFGLSENDPSAKPDVEAIYKAAGINLTPADMPNLLPESAFDHNIPYAVRLGDGRIVQAPDQASFGELLKRLLQDGGALPDGSLPEPTQNYTQAEIQEALDAGTAEGYANADNMMYQNFLAGNITEQEYIDFSTFKKTLAELVVDNPELGAKNNRPTTVANKYVASEDFLEWQEKELARIPDTHLDYEGEHSEVVKLTAYLKGIQYERASDFSADFSAEIAKNGRDKVIAGLTDAERAKYFPDFPDDFLTWETIPDEWLPADDDMLIDVPAKPAELNKRLAEARAEHEQFLTSQLPEGYKAVIDQGNWLTPTYQIRFIRPDGNMIGNHGEVIDPLVYDFTNGEVEAYKSWAIDNPDEHLDNLAYVAGADQALAYSIIDKLYPEYTEGQKKAVVAKLADLKKPPEIKAQEVKTQVAQAIENGSASDLQAAWAGTGSAEAWTFPTVDELKSISPKDKQILMDNLGPFGRQMIAGVGDIQRGVAGVGMYAGDPGGVAHELYGGSQELQSYAMPMTENMALNVWYSGLRSVPFMVSMIPLGMMGGAAGAGVAGFFGRGALGTIILEALGATVLSRPFESIFEASDAFLQAEEKGMSPEDCRTALNTVFWANMTLAGMDFTQFAAAFIPVPWLKTALKTVNPKMVAGGKVAGNLAWNFLTEGGEEVFQNIFQNIGLKQETKWDDDMLLTFLVGGFMGATMGGVFDLYGRVLNKTIEKLPPEIQAEIQPKIDSYTAAGKPEGAARIQAIEEQLRLHPEDETLRAELEKVKKEITAAEPPAGPAPEVPEGYTRAPMGTPPWQEGPTATPESAVPPAEPAAEVGPPTPAEPVPAEPAPAEPALELAKQKAKEAAEAAKKSHEPAAETGSAFANKEDQKKAAAAAKKSYEEHQAKVKALNDAVVAHPEVAEKVKEAVAEVTQEEAAKEVEASKQRQEAAAAQAKTDKELADLAAAGTPYVPVEPATVTPQAELQNIVNRYQEGDDQIATVSDLVDAIDTMGIEDSDLRWAMGEFRSAQADDRALKGRGDMDSAETAIMAAITNYLEKNTPKVKETPSAQTVAMAEDYGKPINGVEGELNTAFGTDAETKYTFRYKVVSLKDLITSHLKDFSKNPIFDQSLQARIRELIHAQNKVMTDAAALGGKADAWTYPSSSLSAGTPIIAQNGVVIAGNGRTLSLMWALSDFPVQFALYKEALLSKAKMYGIDPASIEGMADPVIVRVTDITDHAPLLVLAEDSNARIGGAFDDLSTALTDAAHFVPLDILKLKGSPTAKIDDILTSDQNADFLDKFMATIPQQEMEKYAIIKNGVPQYNKPFLDRLKTALLVYVYKGANGDILAQRFAQQDIHPEIKSIRDATFNTLYAVAKAQALVEDGARASGLKFTEDFADAALKLLTMRQQLIATDGKSKQQAKLFEEEINPTVQKIMGVLDSTRSNTRVVSDFLESAAIQIIDSPDTQQMNMLERPKLPTYNEVIDNAIRTAQSNKAARNKPKTGTPAAADAGNVGRVEERGPTGGNVGVAPEVRPGVPQELGGGVGENQGTTVAGEIPIVSWRNVDITQFDILVQQATLEKAREVAGRQIAQGKQAIVVEKDGTYWALEPWVGKQAPASKRAYRMTFEEYWRENAKPYHAIPEDDPNYQVARDNFRYFHKQDIAKALIEGGSVPMYVLEEYTGEEIKQAKVDYKQAQEKAEKEKAAKATADTASVTKDLEGKPKRAGRKKSEELAGKITEEQTVIEEAKKKAKEAFDAAQKSHKDLLGMAGAYTKEDIALLDALINLARHYVHKAGMTVEKMALDVGLDVSDFMREAWERAKVMPPPEKDKVKEPSATYQGTAQQTTAPLRGPRPEPNLAVNEKKTVKNKSKTLKDLIAGLKELQDNNSANYDPSYHPMDIEEDASRAIDFVANNPQETDMVNSGLRFAPAGITEIAIRRASVASAISEKNDSKLTRYINSLLEANLLFGRNVVANKGVAIGGNMLNWVSAVREANINAWERDMNKGVKPKDKKTYAQYANETVAEIKKDIKVEVRNKAMKSKEVASWLQQFKC